MDITNTVIIESKRGRFQLSTGNMSNHLVCSVCAREFRELGTLLSHQSKDGDFCGGAADGSLIAVGSNNADAEDAAAESTDTKEKEEARPRGVIDNEVPSCSKNIWPAAAPAAVNLKENAEELESRDGSFPSSSDSNKISFPGIQYMFDAMRNMPRKNVGRKRSYDEMESESVSDGTESKMSDLSEYNSSDSDFEKEFSEMLATMVLNHESDTTNESIQFSSSDEDDDSD